MHEHAIVDPVECIGHRLDRPVRLFGPDAIGDQVWHGQAEIDPEAIIEVLNMDCANIDIQQKMSFRYPPKADAREQREHSDAKQ